MNWFPHFFSFFIKQTDIILNTDFLMSSLPPASLYHNNQRQTFIFSASPYSIHQHNQTQYKIMQIKSKQFRKLLVSGRFSVFFSGDYVRTPLSWVLLFCSVLWVKVNPETSQAKREQNNFKFFIRERGLVAEGAKFLLMTLDVKLDEIFWSGQENVCSFDYFRLVNPRHPDFAKLSSFSSEYRNTKEPCQ